MRFRLLRRRLTISAPRVAIRSALPWPFRWLALAVVLGFCAAVALWAFEFGKDIAGLERGVHEQLQQRDVTLDLLWQEFRVGEPDSVSYAQFTRLYRAWRNQQKISMR